MKDKTKKPACRRGGEEELDEGQELCPECGNLMIKEGDKLVCSSCSDDIDFLGDDENESE